MNTGFETPILLIIFSRPDTTKIVFEEIRKVKPKRLFIFCDGARPNNPSDLPLITQSKEVVEVIDWECEVERNYQSENFGCGRGPKMAIDWLFSKTERGIIMEDDCVATSSFFIFCEEMLDRYENNPKVMHISGVNFQDGISRGEGDYYFSKHQHCWGWSTWKRAWKQFEFEMKDYPEFLKNNGFKYVSNKKQVVEYWKIMMGQVYGNKSTDIWDYQWSYAIWKNNGLCITPNLNLISNIGFGPNATHTKWVDFLFNRTRFEMSFPIRHPSKIKADNKADLYFNIFYKAYSPLTLTQKIERITRLFNPKKNPVSIKIYQRLKPYIRKS